MIAVNVSGIREYEMDVQTPKTDAEIDLSRDSTHSTREQQAIQTSGKDLNYASYSERAGRQPPSDLISMVSYASGSPLQNGRNTRKKSTKSSSRRRLLNY